VGPQYLTRALTNYVEAHPLALCDAEILQVWTLGWLPISMKNSAAIFGTTVFCWDQHPGSCEQRRGGLHPHFSISSSGPLLPTGHPDRRSPDTDIASDDHGYLRLGVSVDIVKAAVENASLVIASGQLNVPHVQAMVLFESMTLIHHPP